MTMTFVDAQKNMRQAYFDGGPGVFASGVAWLAAGIAALSISIQGGVIVLLIGGIIEIISSIAIIYKETHESSCIRKVWFTRCTPANGS